MYSLALSTGNQLFAKDLVQLRSHLRHIAARVPAYRALAGVAERGVDGPLQFFELFPEMEKSDLVEQADALFDLGSRSIALFSETSGTTGGKPLVTPRSLEELRWNSRNISKAFERHLTPGQDRVALVHPGLMSPFLEACSLALYQLSVPFLRIYPIQKICDYARLVRVLRDYGITTIMTTPTLANKLLYERRKLSDGKGDWPINKLLLTGELLTRAGLRNSGRLLGGEASAFVYGSSESATCAFGCSQGRYHPYLNDFAFELRSAPEVDRKVNGWELMVTWLNTGVRPLVRYRTGDIVEYGGSCACGEPGLWFEPCGRLSNVPLTVMERKRLDEAMFSMSEPVYHYKLTLGANQRRMTVIIDPEATDKRKASIAAEVASFARQSFDLSLQVDVNPPDDEYYEFSPTAKVDRVVVGQG